MINVSKFVFMSLAVGLAGLQSSVPANADNADVKSIAPLAGLTMTVGHKRAVGYYEAKGNACDLTLHLADAYDDKAVTVNEPVRVKLAVASGTSARVETIDGPTLSFACAPGATAMTVQTLDRVAYVAPAK